VFITLPTIYRISVITNHEAPTKGKVERGVIITLTTIYDWSTSSFNRILAITRAVIGKGAIILSSNVEADTLHGEGERYRSQVIS
jgi:hypothetical protein